MNSIKVALLGPNDVHTKNGVYVECVNRYGAKYWRHVNGYDCDLTQSDLATRHAQIHTLDVPKWVSVTDRALNDIEKLATDFYWSLPASSRDIRSAVSKIRADLAG